MATRPAGSGTTGNRAPEMAGHPAGPRPNNVGWPLDTALTGHISGIDSLFALDRAARAGMLSRRDLAPLIAAGTGYTWAATAVRWRL